MALLLGTALSFAQVQKASLLKVGTTTTPINGSAALDVESTTKGFLPPRMTQAQMNAIPSPAAGLIIYCTDCTPAALNVYNGSAWTAVGGSGSGSATVAANCNTNGFTGTYVSGVALSSASFSVTISNSSFSTSTITFAAGDLVLSGVTGLTVGAPTGSPALSGGAATLTSGQSVIVTYPITGTPGSCGVLTGNWTKLSLSCTKTTGVAPGTFVTNGSNIVRSGSNITSFDANWTAVAGATGYTLEYSTSASGPWTAFPSNPYTGTTAAITGLSAVQYWYRATVIGGICAGSSGTGIAGCGANVGATFKAFMCYNLGVTGTQDPLSYQSGANNGDLYQWGRQTDGHEVRTSLTQAGPVGAPVVNRFITVNSGNYDWISPQSTTLWGDGTTGADPAKATNDPCPAGFKVPSQAQWGGLFRDGLTSGAPNTATRNTWTWTGNGYTVGNFLYLPAAGYRDVSDATLSSVGTSGYYWSSSVNGTYSYYLNFNSGGVGPGSTNYRGYGFSVRCISE